MLQAGQGSQGIKDIHKEEGEHDRQEIQEKAWEKSNFINVGPMPLKVMPLEKSGIREYMLREGSGTYNPASWQTMPTAPVYPGSRRGCPPFGRP